jgi:hypothetical protein
LFDKFLFADANQVPGLALKVKSVIVDDLRGHHTDLMAYPTACQASMPRPQFFSHEDLRKSA